MKLLSKITLLFYLAFTYISLAQDLKILKEAVLFKDNRLFQIQKDGTLKAVEADFELGDLKVAKNGEIRLKDGQKIKLKNGECINKKADVYVMPDYLIYQNGYFLKDKQTYQLLNGQFVKVDSTIEVTNKFKINNLGQIFFNDSVYLQLKDNEFLQSSGEILKRKEDVWLMEGVLMRNSKLFKVEGGRPSPLNTDFNATGNRINTEGQFTSKDGNKLTLNDGEFVSTKGELYFLKSDLLQDLITKRDGKMLVIKAGKTSILDSTRVLPNGNSITINGVLYLQDGNKLHLREGDIILSNGDLQVSKGIKPDERMLEERSLIDHFVFRHGKVLMVKDGEPSIITKELTLTNGARILKHGHLVKPDGGKISLKDGDRISLKGEIISVGNLKKETETTKEKIENPVVVQGPKINNGFLVMRNSILYLVDGSTVSPVSEDITLADKSVMKKTGELQLANGQVTKFKDGDRISMSGKMLPKEKSLPANYITMRKGKVFVITDKKPKAITENYNIDDIVVSPDGTITKGDKKKQIKEGQAFDFKGEEIKGFE